MGKPFRIAPTIIVSDAPAGFQVEVSPVLKGRNYDMWFEHLDHAQAYAEGLSAGSGWPIQERTHGGQAAEPLIYVEQLNRAQWHTRRPRGQYGGVSSWVGALGEALVWASLDRLSVVGIALDGSRMTFAHAQPLPANGGGAA